MVGAEVKVLCFKDLSIRYTDMNDAPVPNRDLAEIPLLVRQSADEIVAALPRGAGDMARYSLGHIASALVLTEGHEAAHTFANEAIESLEVPPEDSFGVWADLLKAGDEKALPKARQALGLTSDGQAFLEERTIIRPGVPERAVELVESGDERAIQIARAAADRAFIINRATLFGRLYRAGDAGSLDLAIEAARDAKSHAEQTGGLHYGRSESALFEMAGFAARNNKADDALKLVEHIETAASRVLVHVMLFGGGRAESLQPALDFLEQSDESSQTRMFIERQLAAAGYAPAVQSIKQRVAGRKGPTFISTDPFLDDLRALHNTGEETAAARLAEAVRSSEAPEYYLHYLGDVGLADLRREMAADLYRRNPSGENAERMLDTQYDKAAWEKAFNYRLHERDNVWLASSLVGLLALFLQASKK